MVKTKKFSLWLMPSSEVYNKLAKIISQLSKEYSTPKFEPHVTLLSQVIGFEKEMIARASQLATLIHPYEIKLATIDYLDEYFRCLFIKAEETKDVMNANLKAREMFGQSWVSRNRDIKYMPHLSLMYGNFSPQIKEKIIEDLGRKFNISFEVRNIHLFFTEGEVDGWYRVKDFILE